MLDNSLVSIIMPTYNSILFIENSINSILKQSYRNFELLITDDNSTDNTVFLIRKYMNLDTRIKLFQNDKNYGAAISRNISLNFAKGRFVAFCDSDDIWLYNKLQDQINFMISNNYYFTYTYYNLFINQYIVGKQIISPNKVNFQKILKNNYIGCSTVIYDQKKIHGFFFPLLKKRQDWAMWLSILSILDYAYCYPFSLTLYRVHDNSLSKNKFKLIKYNYNIYYKYLNYNKFKSLFYLIRFLFFYFKFKLFSK